MFHVKQGVFYENVFKYFVCFDNCFLMFNIFLFLFTFDFIIKIL